jgi:hypothetical protein
MNGFERLNGNVLTIKKYFDLNEWKYGYDSDDHVFTISFSKSEHDDAVGIAVSVEEKKVMLDAFFLEEIAVSKENSQRLNDLANTINSMIALGKFCVRGRVNRVTFNVGIPCPSDSLDFTVFGEILNLAKNEYRDYGPSFPDIAADKCTVEEAIEESEKRKKARIAEERAMRMELLKKYLGKTLGSDLDGDEKDSSEGTQKKMLLS